MERNHYRDYSGAERQRESEREREIPSHKRKKDLLEKESERRIKRGQNESKGVKEREIEKRVREREGEIVRESHLFELLGVMNFMVF